jgi:hypothetical protein
MAANAFATVQGAVFRKEHRSGITKKGPNAGQPYEMDSLHILVPGGGLTEVTLPKDRALLGGVDYAEGDDVSFLVEIRRNEYGFGLSIIRDNIVAEIASRNAA